MLDEQGVKPESVIFRNKVEQHIVGFDFAEPLWNQAQPPRHAIHVGIHRNRVPAQGKAEHDGRGFRTHAGKTEQPRHRGLILHRPKML